MDDEQQKGATPGRGEDKIYVSPRNLPEAGDSFICSKCGFELLAVVGCQCDGSLASHPVILCCGQCMTMHLAKSTLAAQSSVEHG